MCSILSTALLGIPNTVPSMRVSVTESENDGQSLKMFFRRKKADLMMDLIQGRKESVKSMMTHKFQVPSPFMGR